MGTEFPRYAERCLSPKLPKDFPRRYVQSLQGGKPFALAALLTAIEEVLGETGRAQPRR